MTSTASIITIALSAILINNFIFSQFLGCCPFLGCSNKTDTAVGMGLDNDCTAATCGSITGAICGMAGVEEKWYAPFHDRVRTYIIGAEELSIEDVADRFVTLYNT